MPLYHFNVRDDVGGTDPDQEGIELADLDTARREAVHFAGEAVAQNALYRGHCGDWHLEVTDGAGCPLFVVDFRLSPAPAEAMGSTASHPRVRTA